MNGNPKSIQDNQFKSADEKPLYIQGPVSRVTFSNHKKAINDVRPAIKFSKLKRPLSSPGYFGAILLNSGPAHKSPNKRRLRIITRTRIILLSIGAFLVMGGYFTYVALNTVKVSSVHLASFNISSKHSASGKNTAGISTAKVTASELADYTVAPTMPRYLKIPAIGVDARVLSVGVTKDDAIGTPNNVYDTAWFNGSALPGKSGAAVIDGHVSGWTAHGVFYALKSLTIGDQIQIQRGDGTVLTYKVVKSQIYAANNVNMKAVLSPIVNGQQGLNLITCTGEVIPGSNSFNERLVVFATQA